MTTSLELVVLGCSGSYAASGGACTGFLVRSPGASVWLDTGPGTLANLRDHLDFAELDAVVLTHEHPDHWIELPVFYNALLHYEPRPPLPVYGTAGTRALAVRFCSPLDAVFDWTTVADSDEVTIGDQRWRFSRTDHYVETLACRIDAGGRSLVFTADTGPGWSATAFGDGIDVLLSESTFLAEREPERILHLSARQAATMASDAGVGTLALTHLAPIEDGDAHLAEAGAHFAGPVRLVAVGDTIPV